MAETTTPLKPLGPPSRGVSASDVSHAADSLLRAGERPTIEKIRSKLGKGSPNTINPLLDAWWKTLSARLDSGPAALHRLPETVAHVAEALWMQALDEGRRRAQLELKSARNSAADQQQALEVRSHVLTLREGELDARLRDRETTIAGLQLQLRQFTLLLRKEQAAREFSSPGRAVRAFPALARHRRARGATPARLPESRPRPLNSVAVSLPQGRRAKRLNKPRRRAAMRNQLVARPQPRKKSRRAGTPPTPERKPTSPRAARVRISIKHKTRKRKKPNPSKARKRP